MKTETSSSYRNANATHYDEQAQTFLDRFQIKFRATLSDSKVAPWSDEVAGERHHYRCTLSHAADRPRESTGASRRITFDFFGSIADCADGKHPTPYDVLACISGDTYCPDTFKEWADEFGESEDSIKALQTYRRFAAFAKRLQAFFTQEELEALGEIK